MRICCSLRLWGVVVLAQWLNQHPVNGALVVDLRWQPDYMWYDPRERRGFVPWERTGCPHSPVKTPTAAPVQKAERRKSLLSCLTQGGSSRCEAEGRHPIECAQASSVRAGISSVRHNYFSDPPPREELRRHYRQLRDSTATWRGVHVHAYGSHDGPWLENHFLRRFFSKGFDYWYPLVPLFVQTTDTMYYGKQPRHAQALEEFFTGQPYADPADGRSGGAAGGVPPGAGGRGGGGGSDYRQQRPPALRSDVVYVMVVQHDIGPLAISANATLWRNTLVFSAGGWGNVPLPLLTHGRCIESDGPPAAATTAGAASAALSAASVRRSHLLSFVGRIDYREVQSGVSETLQVWRHSLMRALASQTCFSAPQRPCAGAEGPGGMGGASPQCPADGMPPPLPLAARLLSSSSSASHEAHGHAECGLHLQLWRRNEAWRDVTRDSLVSLALRGVGATSFRMYETLQMGRIPLYAWQWLRWLPFGNAKQPLYGPEGVALVAHAPDLEAWVQHDLPGLVSAAGTRAGSIAALVRAAHDAAPAALPASRAAPAADRDAEADLQGQLPLEPAPAPPPVSSYSLPATSQLARMEDRLRDLHDSYFTYDAVMQHIEDFLADPDAAELHCEAKPAVVSD